MEMHRRFTLIELLVVVAIIAVLAAMLLPALSRARESATLARCLSNQRQVGIGIAEYRSENNEFLPPTITELGSSHWEMYGNGYDIDGRIWSDILIDDGLLDKGVFDCVSIGGERTEGFGGVPVTDYPDYGWLTYHNDGYAANHPEMYVATAQMGNDYRKSPWRTDKITRPEEGMLMTENNGDALYGRGVVWYWTLGDPPHGRSFGVLFHDLHVEGVNIGTFPINDYWLYKDNVVNPSPHWRPYAPYFP